jgi:hypothetical protein
MGGVSYQNTRHHDNVEEELGNSQEGKCALLCCLSKKSQAAAVF